MGVLNRARRDFPHQCSSRAGLKLWQVTEMHAGRWHRDEDLDHVLMLKLHRAEHVREGKRERDRAAREPR